MGKKIDEKDKKIEELTELAKRIQADFENYKKRTEKEKEEFTQYACVNVIKEILPVLDSFELAMKNTESDDIKVLYAQMWEILEKKGLSKIEALGKEFNPYLCEALLQEEGEEDNKVIEILQPGYLLGEQVLRHAKVKICKKKQE